MKPVTTYAPVSVVSRRPCALRGAPAALGPSERGEKKPRPPPTQLIGDDYTSKTTLKVKCAPKSGPPISYTIEDEVKPDGVAGKLTLKYVEGTPSDVLWRP